jgi:hypothetical protein
MLRRTIPCVLAVELLACPRAPSGEGASDAVSPTAQPEAVVVAAPAPSASASDAADVATPDLALALPAVNVVWIGMHIGGGPNDDEHKLPIARDIEAHFDELRACYLQVTPRASGVLGVDLLIPSSGGLAQVSRPRTTLEGEGFVPCAVAVLAAVRFSPPKTGLATNVAYSVRFVPR